MRFPSFAAAASASADRHRHRVAQSQWTLAVHDMLYLTGTDTE